MCETKMKGLTDSGGHGSQDPRTLQTRCEDMSVLFPSILSSPDEGSGGGRIGVVAAIAVRHARSSAS